ncbi:MAG: hypothetical protein VW547_00305 [Alphaproteobacteria bacterium]
MCLVVAALSFSSAADNVVIAASALRILSAIALCLVLWQVIRSDTRAILVNPPLFLAVQAILLYSVVLWLARIVGSDEWAQFLEKKQLRGYLGDSSEMLVLGFGAVCLAAAVYPSLRAAGPALAEAERLRAIPDRLSLALVLIACTAAAFYVLQMVVPGVRTFAKTSLGSEIHAGAAPVLAFGLSAGVQAFARRRALVQAGMIVAIGFCSWSMMLANQAPLTIFMVGALALFWLSVAPLKSRRVFLWAGIVVAALLAIVALKTKIINDRGLTERPVILEDVLVTKLVERQAVSAGCLKHVVDTYLGSGISGNPLYFAGAVVPRAVWPDKPNLSRGGEFGMHYCGIPVSAKKAHSETITLLGEPVLEAGAQGLAVAIAIVLGISLLALRAATGSSATCMITAVALVPWISTFQQHFALYIANAAKMFVFMVPLIVIVRLAQRRSTSAV